MDQVFLSPYPPFSRSFGSSGFSPRCFVLSPPSGSLLDSSQIRCRHLLTPDTARMCESVVPLPRARIFIPRRTLHVLLRMELYKNARINGDHVRQTGLWHDLKRPITLPNTHNVRPAKIGHGRQVRCLIEERFCYLSVSCHCCPSQDPSR